MYGLTPSARTVSSGSSVGRGPLPRTQTRVCIHCLPRSSEVYPSSPTLSTPTPTVLFPTVGVTLGQEPSIRSRPSICTSTHRETHTHTSTRTLTSLSLSLTLSLTRPLTQGVVTHTHTRTRTHVRGHDPVVTPTQYVYSHLVTKGHILGLDPYPRRSCPLSPPDLGSSRPPVLLSPYTLPQTLRPYTLCVSLGLLCDRGSQDFWPREVGRVVRSRGPPVGPRKGSTSGGLEGRDRGSKPPFLGHRSLLFPSFSFHSQSTRPEPYHARKGRSVGRGPVDPGTDPWGWG